MVSLYDSLISGSWEPYLSRPWLLLLAATVIEFVWGEPPSAVHPVVWMGRLCTACMRHAPDHGRVRQFAFGLVVAALLPLGFAGISAWAISALTDLPALRFIVASWILSTTFSVRALGTAAGNVATSLRAPVSLKVAQFHLRALCSRDATLLDAPLVAAAAIESVAENSSDSFVAPLVFFALFGVPGAVFYRAVNTLDAMIGYRGKYEVLGKPSARLDDLLNWLPARLTALLLIISGSVWGHPGRRGWHIALRDHGNTESPNAGWPMAAMAGLLGLQLEKRNHYVLGDAGVAVCADHVDASWRVALTCFVCALALVVAWTMAFQPWEVLP